MWGVFWKSRLVFWAVYPLNLTVGRGITGGFTEKSWLAFWAVYPSNPWVGRGITSGFTQKSWLAFWADYTSNPWVRRGITADLLRKRDMLLFRYWKKIVRIVGKKIKFLLFSWSFQGGCMTKVRKQSENVKNLMKNMGFLKASTRKTSKSSKNFMNFLLFLGFFLVPALILDIIFRKPLLCFFFIFFRILILP